MSVNSVGSGTRPLGTTGNLPASRPAPAKTGSTTGAKPAVASDRSEVKGAAIGGMTGLLAPVAESMASSNNAETRIMGEVMQLVLSGKEMHDIKGEIGGIVEKLKEKGFAPEKLESLTKAGKLARVFDMAQGMIAGVRLAGQAKELVSDPSKIKDPEFLSEFISNGGTMTRGMLGFLELVKNSPIAGKIPGIAGMIGDVAGLVGDFGKLTDGKVEASEVIGTLAHATSLAANALTVLAPATGGTSLAVAAALKGVSLGLTGVEIAIENWDKVKSVGSTIANGASSAWSKAKGLLGFSHFSTVHLWPQGGLALAKGYA